MLEKPSPGESPCSKAAAVSLLLHPSLCVISVCKFGKGEVKGFGRAVSDVTLSNSSFVVLFFSSNSSFVVISGN